jgi:ribosomal protein S18 acetylase RimI-like enzyme
MIDVRDDHKLDVKAFARLRERCAFSVKPPEFLAALIAGSRWIAHAYDPAAGDRLVGFARAISDGVATAYLSSVMVDPDYRRRGVGRAMVQRILQGREDIKFVLHSNQGATAYYAAIGFSPITDMMARDRR